MGDVIIEEVGGLVLGSGVRVYTYRFQGVRLSEHSQHACFSFNFLGLYSLGFRIQLRRFKGFS